MRIQMSTPILFAIVIAIVPPGRAQSDPMEVAFMNHDFLRTIELAKSVTPSSNKTYCLTGASYFELGRSEDASLYLSQAIALSDVDQAYKQAARLYLMRLNLPKLNTNQANARSELGKLLADFSSARARPALFTEDEATRITTQARSLVNDISGDWAGLNGHVYRFSRQDASTFRVGISHPTVAIVSLGGTLIDVEAERADPGKVLRATTVEAIAFLENLAEPSLQFRGKFRYGELLRSLNSGVEHEVELKLHWTSDFRQLTGTATYRFSREPFGPARDMFIQAYPPRTVDITLTRK